jgi:DNA invertase Pin-like site-specific DNA recombinase
VKAGKVDAVIVLSFDRLARVTLMILDLVDTFRLAGVALVSCKE